MRSALAFLTVVLSATMHLCLASPLPLGHTKSLTNEKREILSSGQNGGDDILCYVLHTC